MGIGIPAERLVVRPSEVFHYIILVSDSNGRTRIGARTVLKLDFELGLILMNGFHFARR